jgi:parallel beta-helix repeat protein
MLKQFYALLIIITFSCSLLALCSLQQGQAWDYTFVDAGVINSDTVWKKENGQYLRFQGSVTVAKGVTLTIEPEVSVELCGFNLQVDGVLVAIGNDQLNGGSFNGGKIIFSNTSIGWNQQTGRGNLIENWDFSGVTIEADSSVNIFKCSADSGITISGNVMLSECYVALMQAENDYTSPNNGHSINILSGSPIVYNNTVKGEIYSGSTDSPRIFNNTVNGAISVGLFYYLPVIADSPIIYGNTVYSSNDGIFVYAKSPMITNNTIIGPGINGRGTCGIMLYVTAGGNALVSDNTISSFLSGITDSANSTVTIENNYITLCGQGINGVGSNVIIRNNTFTENLVGINIFLKGSPVIEFNNIQNSLNNSIYLADIPWQNVLISDNINAANNWWGTTDESKIASSIYDNKYDSALGTVNFTPFLTSPNPQAMPDPTAAIPTPSIPSTTFTPSPTPDAMLIESNSTVSAFSFNASIPEISFTVAGPDGTTGYTRLSISKTFMPNADTIQVYIDGNKVNSEITSNGDIWQVTFTYHHSSHQVAINTVQPQSNASVPDWVWTLTIAVMVIALGVAAVVIVWLAKRKT